MKLSCVLLLVLASVAVAVPTSGIVRRSEAFDECFHKCMAVGKGTISEPKGVNEPNRMYCAADCKKEGAGGGVVG
ncbi:hypothetical protein B0T14DRAFT_526784 [Immersiella caudata]|uniref:Uncharacterized protein n=1 Tax=Immersiella caudata TaxID=314043 RepID=A0AA39WE63_9PEZI|nr:hypothetical protein B0T14DRAFT_526784 [Immersiella caudata]